MADNLRMALDGLIRKAQLDQDADFLREGVRVLSEALMELEVSHHLGAERYQRTSGRNGQRNGYRGRTWDTRVGTIDLHVPRVRDGTYFPSLLEPRRRAERALVAVVQENQGMSSNVDIKNLTAAERLELLADIWDSLDPEDVPVTDAQRTELDRRLDELERDPDLGIPWQKVLRQIRDHSK